MAIQRMILGLCPPLITIGLAVRAPAADGPTAAPATQPAAVKDQATLDRELSATPNNVRLTGSYTILSAQAR